jgi:DNA-binding LacI/PurR family transcriptional regulator
MLDSHLILIIILDERSHERSSNSLEIAALMNKRHVTLKQVASSAGVSYQTVSKVLNRQIQVTKETEDRIWEAARTLGYRPSFVARSLRTQRAFTIGYSWPPSSPEHENIILDQFLQSMFLAAEERGYYLLCFPYHANIEQHLATYSELMETRRVDGFVLSNIEYDDPRVALLLERNFPFVAFGRSNPDLIFPWVDVDGGWGIHKSMMHLLEQGHRKIGALAWPQDSRVGNNRMEGYFSALQEAGIPIKEEWIKRGEGAFDFGYKAALELLDLPQANRPTAVIALNDMMALGASQAAKDRGLRVGPEFAVTGFDDAPMVQYTFPPLTTLRQPISEIGQCIISMLMEYINLGETPEHPSVLVAPQLIVRGSTVQDWSK